jgi:hypothetical protein
MNQIIKIINFKVLFYLIFLIVLLIFIYNIFFYTPVLGYDGEAHFAYVDHLATSLPKNLSLPTEIDTREFFNPPLPYLFPAFIQVFCRNLIESNNYIQDCQPIYGFFTQIFQTLIYFFTLFVSMRTLKLINGSADLYNFSFLILMSCMSVTYKAFSMLRGEPYILLFLSLFLFYIFKLQEINFVSNKKTTLILGLIIGCIALSRQWGFLLFPALIILLFSKTVNSKKNYFKLWATSSGIGFMISGWFYTNLFYKYNSFLAFNMQPSKVTTLKMNELFYLPSIDSIKLLFNEPIRPNLDNKFFSILYSDLWGDYWGYFSFTSKYLDIGRDQLAIGSYLGRVNLVSLFIFLILLITYLLSIFKKNQTFIFKYINYSIFISMLGYIIFFLSFPTETGDTVKGVYIIQVFYLLAFLASSYLEALKDKNFKLYAVINILFIVIFVHNINAYVSHFPYDFYPK